MLPQLEGPALPDRSCFNVLSSLPFGVRGTPRRSEGGRRHSPRYLPASSMQCRM